MAKYWKHGRSPVVVEAVHWLATDDSYKEVCGFVGNLLPYNDEEGELTITTPKGELTVSEGDYIVRGVDGDYSACKPDTFVASHDLIV